MSGQSGAFSEALRTAPRFCRAVFRLFAKAVAPLHSTTLSSYGRSLNTGEKSMTVHSIEL